MFLRILLYFWVQAKRIMGVKLFMGRTENLFKNIYFKRGTTPYFRIWARKKFYWPLKRRIVHWIIPGISTPSRKELQKYFWNSRPLPSQWEKESAGKFKIICEYLWFWIVFLICKQILSFSQMTYYFFPIRL